MATGVDGIGFASGLREGVWLLSEGFRFLRREPRLWPFATIPVLLTVVAVGAAATAFWLHLAEIHAAFLDLLPMLEATDWWTWIWIGPGKALVFGLSGLGVVLSFAVALVASLLIANLASAPFLDALSERVETIATGRPLAEGEGFWSVVRGAVGSFVAELRRLALLGGVWVVLSLAGFLVPGAHLVTGPLLVGTTVLFLPLDYAGFALDRRGVPFAARRRWIRAHLPTMLGFGGVAFVCCLVPGVNLVVLPALVTAGTLLVLRSPVGGDAPLTSRR